MNESVCLSTSECECERVCMDEYVCECECECEKRVFACLAC